MMPEVIAKPSSSLCLLFASAKGDRDVKKERQTVCHIMSILFLILHVGLLRLGGPAMAFSYLGAQT